MSDANFDPKQQLSAVDAELARFERWLGIVSVGLLVPTLTAYAVLI